MHTIYSLIYRISLLFFLPYEYFKRPTILRSRWIREKFGFIRDKRHIWIHSVSVGEVNAIVPLVRHIQRLFPDYRILLTTVTDTGQEVAKRQFGTSVDIAYIPFDLPSTLDKMLKGTMPELILITETEIWPNLIRIARKNSIPIAIINGRLSEKSFKRYKKISFLMRSVLNDIDLFLMQNEVYAKRIIDLGADPSRVRIMGNLKFDIEISKKDLIWAERFNKRVIVAGSTHEPEEEIILKGFLDAKRVFADTILIIAPRHPQRFKSVEELLSRANIHYIKRSQVNDNTDLNTFDVILLDAMGELYTLYKYCDIAILGGSFIPHGGQNPLEPAYWGKAIVCGRYMHNFYFIDDFLRVGAAIQTDVSELSHTLINLLSDTSRLQTMGKRAKDLMETNRGAVNRLLDEIKGFLYH
ncbi:MAG: 3-deoxy-D-manno-octulosonic acid transferase [Thermodesulfovibrionales bacterium]